jgi:hypothetical protein
MNNSEKATKDLGCACYGNNEIHHCFCKETNMPKLNQIQVKMQEVWQQTTPKIHKSKKTYSRKNKHKNNVE